MRRWGAAVGAAVALAAPAGAHAAVEIGPERVVVSGDGARAVVQRAPFRLAIQDGGGRTVLQQASATLPLPQPSTTPQPEPGGVNVLPEAAPYAPFVFEVGGEKSAQIHGGPWAGNQLAGGRAGVAHAAREVTAASRAGEGVRLTVATTDPTRPMTVTISPDGAGAIRVVAELASPAGVTSFGDSFASGPDEAFRGFGGRHNALDQRGRDFYNWIEQENFGSGPGEPIVAPFPALGGSEYMFPNGPTAAYYVHNEFVSSRPYGFFVNETALTRWRMASDRADAWQFAADDGSLDYTVAVGDAKQSIERLTAITGRQRVPPAWAQGPALKRNVQIEFSGKNTPATYERQIRDDIAQIDKYKLKLTGFAYEGWHALKPDAIRDINANLRRRGIHPIGYLRAFISNDGAFFDDAQLYNEAIEKGYVAKTPTGQPYLYVGAAPAAVIDFTNPEAVKWWERRLREMLDLGFDGFMQDFGEQTMVDMVFHNGETGRTMHNKYPNVFHQVTRRIVDEYMREHPKREIFFYTRAGFSGRDGSSADFENSNFPGDETTDWNPGTGLPSLAPDMLNRGLFGAVGFNTGIGGYIDSYNDNLTKDLFIRWSQWAALTPFFRVHNSCCDTGTRMPWSFDDETVELFRAMADLHTRALPLIRRLWQESTRTGVPIARPLWLEYPNDAQAAKQEQQWLLGPDVLVAPVVEKGATSREVYFPRGCWQEEATGRRFNGPVAQRVDAPLARLPWFVRCGTKPLDAAAGCRDRIAPVSRVNRRSVRATRRGVRAGGRTSDRGCGVRGAGRVRRVYVSVARVRGKRCYFVTRRGRLLRRARSCRRPVLLPARGVRKWRFKLETKGLPRGRYRLQARGVDAARNKERPGKRANATFRVR